jgi:hypothetical protein
VLSLPKQKKDTDKEDQVEDPAERRVFD